MQLHIDKTELDDFIERNNLSASDKASLEEKLQALMQRGERDLLRLRKESLDAFQTLARARKNGHIPLKSLIDILASQEAIASLKAGEIRGPKVRGRVELERHEVYKSVLGNAKREILARRLIVRTLTAPHPLINEEPAIKEWCESNHTLQSIEQAAPHGRIVVGIEDAQRWVQRMLGTIPAWLQMNSSNPEEKKRRRDRQIEAIVSLCKDLGFDPLSIPDGGRAKIKAAALESDPSLFPDSGFDHAWTEARRRGLVQMTNHDTYSNSKKKK